MHQQLPFKRTDRVGQQIKSILGDIALKYISLKHLGFVTFTSVDVSNDLRNAKVFYSVLNPKIKIESIENEMNKFLLKNNFKILNRIGKDYYYKNY